MRGALSRAVGVAALWLALTPAAQAHEGPPFPIVMDRPTGPYIVSIWTDPDIGTGKFWVILAPAPGTTLPDDFNIQVCVQPLTGRLPEACSQASRDSVRDRVQYYAEVEFDQQEMWRVRVRIEANGKPEEVVAEVEATPPGYGRWDLLIYSFPFVFIGAMWLFGMLRRRRRSHDPQSPPSCGLPT